MIFKETDFYICSLMDCSFWKTQGYPSGATYEIMDWSKNKNKENLEALNIDPNAFFGNSYPFFNFDGINDFIELPHTFASFANVGTNNFTVWGNFKTNSDTIVKRIIGKGVAYTTNIGWNVHLNTYGNIVFRLNDGSTLIEAKSSTNYHDNSWHTFIAIRNNTDLFVYVDKNLVASYSGTTIINPNNTQPLHIGQTQVGNYFIGQICEISFISKAISEIERNFIFDNNFLTRLI